MSEFNMSRFDLHTLQSIAGNIELPADLLTLEGQSVVFQSQIIPGGMGFGPRDYWKALKTELSILICGPHKGEIDPYQDLRVAAEKHGAKSQLAIVSSIAVFIGARVGLEAGFLIPWIAIILGVVQKVGAKAFCRAIRSPALNA